MSKFVHLHEQYPVTLDFHLDTTDQENQTPSQQLTIKDIVLNIGSAEMKHNVQGTQKKNKPKTKKPAFFDKREALLSLQLMDFPHHPISKP